MGSLLQCCPKDQSKAAAKNIDINEKEATLYELVGGISGLDAFVELFYKKMLADEKIKPFFETISIPMQKKHMKRFLAQTFGGPRQYMGRSIYEAHARTRKMGLNEDIFNLVVGHLVATLTEMCIAQEQIDSVVKIALSVKDDVLGVSPPVLVLAVNSNTLTEPVQQDSKPRKSETATEKHEYFGQYVDEMTNMDNSEVV